MYAVLEEVVCLFWEGLRDIAEGGCSTAPGCDLAVVVCLLAERKL